MPVGDGGEDTDHCSVVELVDRYHLQVTEESTGHVVATAARGRHRSHKQLQRYSRGSGPNGGASGGRGVVVVAVVREQTRSCHQ